MYFSLVFFFFFSNEPCTSGGLSTLTPLKGGPSSLIPLSPDGESVLDFSGAEDVASLRSSSQVSFYLLCLVYC